MRAATAQPRGEDNLAKLLGEVDQLRTALAGAPEVVRRHVAGLEADCDALDLDLERVPREKAADLAEKVEELMAQTRADLAEVQRIRAVFGATAEMIRG